MFTKTFTLEHHVANPARLAKIHLSCSFAPRQALRVCSAGYVRCTGTELRASNSFKLQKIKDPDRPAADTDDAAVGQCAHGSADMNLCHPKNIRHILLTKMEGHFAVSCRVDRQ